MLFHCKVCGKESSGKPSEGKKYCSVECFRSTRNPRIKYICKSCGKEGECKPSINKKFCSKKCGGIDRTQRLTVEVKCAQCNTPFIHRKGSPQTFCSFKCSMLSSRTQIDFTCVICGVQGKCNPGRPRKYCSRVCFVKAGEIKRTYSCTECSIVFQISKEGKPKRGKPFCSSNCFNIYQTGENNVSWQGVKELRSCQNCEKNFWIKGSNRKSVAKFCSNTCRATFLDLDIWIKTQREYFQCISCSRLTKTKKNRLSFNKCCSSICYENLRLNEKRKYGYPRNWTPALKEMIRKRDNYQCKICDKSQHDHKRALHVHHIDYDKNNSASNNLITLCFSCHNKKAHGKDSLLWKEKLSKLLDE